MSNSVSLSVELTECGCVVSYFEHPGGKFGKLLILKVLIIKTVNELLDSYTGYMRTEILTVLQQDQNVQHHQRPLFYSILAISFHFLSSESFLLISSSMFS